MNEDKKSYTCTRCDKTTESKRIPMGWKLISGTEIVCAACRSQNYVQRVVSLPVDSIVTEEADVKPWTPFKRAWDLATSLANWCQIELMKFDSIRTPAMEAMPKFNRKMFSGDRDLYGHWNHECPFRDEFNGATGSAATMIRAIEKRWASHPEFGRFAVLWRRDSASPVARWPQPWVVRKQD